MKTRPVILQLTTHSSINDDVLSVGELACYGLIVTQCADLAEIRQQIGVSYAVARPPIIVILDGRNAGHCTAATALRALYNNIGIVVMVDACDEASVVLHLQSGADTYCAVDASPQLLAAIMFRLLWRLGSHHAQPNPLPQAVQYNTAGNWRLTDQDWMLSTPNGGHIALTTGERAFLSTLLKAPGQQATHQELSAAVNASYDTVSSGKDQSRLGVMVSRMRRKFSQAGVPLPLKSIHNWGYMFAAGPSSGSSTPPQRRSDRRPEVAQA